MNDFNKEILGQYIDVTQYKTLRAAIPDKRLEIVELILTIEIETIRSEYHPYLDGIEANPAAVTLDDEMIFIGSGVDNKGYVYYVHIEFGVFKLHESTEAFSNSLIR